MSVDHKLKVILTSALASAAVLATSAFGIASAHHDVTLDVDGVSRPVSGFSADVRSVLASQGVTVGAYDLVSPSLDEAVEDGDQVVVRHVKAYELTNTDGQTVVVRSTADTISSVVQPGLFMAADRSRSRAEIPLVRAGEKVSIDVDSTTLSVTATGEDTVASLLRKAGVTVSRIDRVKMSSGSSGLRIVIDRVTRGTTTTNTTIPHGETTHEDPTMDEGTTKVTQEGQDGQRTDTFYVEKVNGVTTVEVHTATSTTQPVDKDTAVGTKKVVATAAATSTTSATTSTTTSAPASVPVGTVQEMAQQLLAQRGWADQWSAFAALVNRESGWNVSATNSSSGAYGIPQALPGSKMASHGSDWKTNPATQLAWMLDYIAGRYGDPNGAWAHSQATGWY